MCSHEQTCRPRVVRRLLIHTCSTSVAAVDWRLGEPQMFPRCVSCLGSLPFCRAPVRLLRLLLPTPCQSCRYGPDVSTFPTVYDFVSAYIAAPQVLPSGFELPAEVAVQRRRGRLVLQFSNALSALPEGTILFESDSVDQADPTFRSLVSFLVLCPRLQDSCLSRCPILSASLGTG